MILALLEKIGDNYSKYLVSLISEYSSFQNYERIYTIDISETNQFLMQKRLLSLSHIRPSLQLARLLPADLFMVVTTVHAVADVFRYKTKY